jgi:hypothetical protein
MRQAIVFAALISSTCPAKDVKTQITVRAVSHEAQFSQRIGTYSTPGTSSTNCSGSATTIGNTTSGVANCQTTSTPPQTHQVVTSTLDVTNVVEANGMRYTVACRASWIGSNCGPMIDGDSFPAEIGGTTMWIEAHRGGNLGKKVRVKHRILDVRAYAHLVSDTPTLDALVAARQESVGQPLDNTGVLEMVRAGIKEDTIIYIVGLRPARYSLSLTDRAALREAGVFEAIIGAMAEKSAIR